MATRVDKASLYKKGTFENLALLHKIQPMLTKTAKLILEENGLEKTTQNLFYNVTYYLLFIIDPQVHSSLTWPLYDTKAERAYKRELSAFISDSASKGLLTDVRPSYLVNPTSFNITVLVYQLSVLAVKRILTQRIKGSEKQSLYDEVTEKYSKSKPNNSKSFIDYMENLNYKGKVTNKLTSFLVKEQSNEKIAEMLRSKIVVCETKTLKAKTYIDDLIDGIVTKYKMDESLKNQILEIKDINKTAAIFDDWLKAVDEQTDCLEATWNAKVSPLMENCRKMYTLSEEIVMRNTGQIEKSSYTLVYDPKTDEICTDELQNQVNSCQKQILRNIQSNGRLSFPNLIRAYTISMCYILNNVTIGDELYEFSKTVEDRKTEYEELCLGYRALVKRLKNNEKKLKLTQPKEDDEYFEEEVFVIPPMPDLSGIKMKQNKYPTFDGFTPLNIPKHRFNLLKRGEMFARPPPRSISNYNTYHAPRDDFLRTLLSCRVSSYDRSHTSNTSVISNIKANETIAECSSGFTKQQIERLLSTKKKSSTKKHKNKNEHHNNSKMKRLFNDSIISSESNLFRSYSSPNLLENRDRIHKSSMKRQGRKLSIMAEDSPPQLDMSGISCLNSNFNTPVGNKHKIPKITITPAEEVASLKLKANETIAECSSGFTKQQIEILLSTKKKSSTKKHKNKNEHHNHSKMKRLFNDSIISSESNLFRSYSSPNLLENRDRIHKSSMKRQGRKLSIMAEDSPPQLDMSGISCLNSNFNTPVGNKHKIPKITITPAEEVASLKLKANETIAECSSGFTKQQIEILLSTKKKSSTKKHKNKNEHHNHSKMKRLFNDSIISSESNLFRSYSSPNLLENRDRIHKSSMKRQGRKLSIMAEDSPPQLDMSGISCLNSNFNTPVGNKHKIPKITITPARDVQESLVSRIARAADLPNSSISPIMPESHSKTETPKTNTALVAKTSSLEKIINRFKQFRSSIQPLKDEKRTIVEEKENINTNAGLNANRNLLPDLLSPSCSSLNIRSNCDDLVDPIDIDLDEMVRRVPRVSLGTMLGVDHTFLDQYDLSD